MSNNASFNQSNIQSKLSPGIKYMKTHQTFILVAICLNFATIGVAAQKKSGEILHGVVESVDGNNITVNYRRKSRSFRLNDQATINYVGFLKAKKEIKPGFVIRAGVDSKGHCNQLWVTLPIPSENLKPSEKMLAMTPGELYQMADSDSDGELSYVEYATAIYRSPKHGPVGFMKSDKDKSGTLSPKEFTEPNLKTSSGGESRGKPQPNGTLNMTPIPMALSTSRNLSPSSVPPPILILFLRELTKTALVTSR